MDLIGNRSEFLNFRYRRNLGRGVLDARVFWQNVRHEMNIGKDKSTFPMAMWMPMDTHGRDLGYTVKLEIPSTERHTFQLGSEFQRFVLDDTWPAVPGTAPYMGPNPFINMNDGVPLAPGVVRGNQQPMDSSLDHAAGHPQRYGVDQCRAR